MRSREPAQGERAPGGRCAAAPWGRLLACAAIAAAAQLRADNPEPPKEVSLSDTLGFIAKHRGDFQAEWHTSEGPVRWQPEDFKNFTGTRNVYWDQTIRWTIHSDCPQFGKELNPDGETYSIARAETLVGDETDVSEQDTYKDAHYTKQIWASYAWRFKVAQVRAAPIVIDYKEYLKRTSQTDNQTVDEGTYFYVCIVAKDGADPDAIIEIGNDEKVDDGRGNVTTVKGYRSPVTIAGFATVRDQRMAERLARTVGHLISLLQAKQLQPKEPF